MPKALALPRPRGTRPGPVNCRRWCRLTPTTRAQRRTRQRGRSSGHGRSLSCAPSATTIRSPKAARRSFYETSPALWGRHTRRRRAATSCRRTAARSLPPSFSGLSRVADLRVIVPTPTFARSRTFYRDTLGASVVEEWPADEFQPAGMILRLRIIE